MMDRHWSDRRVRAALGLAGAADVTFAAVSTDTRAIAPGALFVALAGDHFDAHNFLAAAASAGAVGAVVRIGTPPVAGLVLYEVPDTLRALGDLAAHRRRDCDGPVIAITGQNGKTSTKEMVAAVLGTRWVTHRTRANLNNLIGVPMTVLEAPSNGFPRDRGGAKCREIARYREIVKPDVASCSMPGPGISRGSDRSPG